MGRPLRSTGVHRLVVVAGLGAAIAFARDAGAQGDPTVPVPTNPAATDGAAVASVPEEPGKAAYDRSIELYAQGDKPSALAAMEEAYRLSKQPELLYNIARLKRELGRCKDALDAYRAFLRDAGPNPYRDPARAAARELDATCGPPVPGKPTYWTTSRVIGWSSVAAGVAAGAGALYLALHSRSLVEDEQSLLDAYSNNPNRPWNRDASERQRDLAQGAEQSQNLARIFTIAGSGLIAGGVLVLTLMPGPKEGPPRVALGIDGNGAYLGCAGRF